MNILKNKHFVIALLVAPILALISYFSVDAAVSEVPHVAVSGSEYELVEKPNCRYSSGHCQLNNGDFELELKGTWKDDVHLQLELESEFPLEGVMAAQIDVADSQAIPAQMIALNESRTRWGMMLVNPSIEQSRIRLAASSNQTLYYGDAGLAFVDYKTSFDDDFRQ
jgi:hypothetical protein